MTTTAESIAMVLDSLIDRVDSLGSIADEIDSIVEELKQAEQPHPRGTILKATPLQTRFKPKSMWVSLGDGTYKHLNGKKGLVTTHDRLNGYTSVIFQA